MKPHERASDFFTVAPKYRTKETLTAMFIAADIAANMETYKWRELVMEAYAIRARMPLKWIQKASSLIKKYENKK